MPPLEQTLRELNELLADHALPPCTRLEPPPIPPSAILHSHSAFEPQRQEARHGS